MENLDPDVDVHAEESPGHYRMPGVEELLHEYARAWHLPIKDNRSARRWFQREPVKADTEREVLLWMARELSDAGILAPFSEAVVFNTLQTFVMEWRRYQQEAQDYQKAVPARLGRWMTFEHLRFVSVSSAILTAAASKAIPNFRERGEGWFQFDSRSVGDLIREWANEAGMSLADLKRELDYHAHTLDDWLSGKYFPTTSSQQEVTTFFADRLKQDPKSLAHEMRHRVAMSWTWTRLREHLGDLPTMLLEEGYRHLVDALVLALDELAPSEEVLAGLMLRTTSAPEVPALIERALVLDEGQSLRAWRGLLCALPCGLSAWRKRAAAALRGFHLIQKDLPSVVPEEVQVAVHMAIQMSDLKALAAAALTDENIGQSLRSAGVSPMRFASESLARHYQQSGDPLRELRVLRRAIHETPDDPDILHWAGRLALQLAASSDDGLDDNLWNEGLYYLMRASHHRPGWAGPWTALVDGAVRLHGWLVALVVLDAVPDGIVWDFGFRRRLAAALVKAGLWERARDELEALSELDPDHAFIWDLLAYCHHRLKNTKERGRAEKRAKELGGGYTAWWRARCKEAKAELPFGEEERGRDDSLW